MPPEFSDVQRLPDDEVVDIMLHAVPNSWKKELIKQGRDPDLMGSYDLLIALEQIEAAEDFDKTAVKTPAKKARTSPGGRNGGRGGNNRSNNNNNDNNNGSYYCMKHGKNTTHNTEDCKVIKSMVASVDKKKSGNDGNKNKNKTWTRKNNDSNNKDEKKKEANSFSKKRKAESDDDSVSDGELNLTEFNYDKLENLSLDDEASA